VSINPAQDVQRLQAVVARAVEDQGFRQQLIASPNQELTNAGVTVPQGVTVEVHENTATTVHLVIPLSPPVLVPQPAMLVPYHFV
jgi:hypothetical protein